MSEKNSKLANIKIFVGKHFPCTMLFQCFIFHFFQVTNLIQDKAAIIKECKELCKNYGHNALSALNHFHKSEARTALENIVKAVISL